MDEPFKGLDEPLAARIIQQIRKLHEINKQTIIFVSHQPDTLTLLADETIKL
jgi:ABC-type multidrug transport system ATPase subunit